MFAAEIKDGGASLIDILSFTLMFCTPFPSCESSPESKPCHINPKFKSHESNIVK
jgi:hypothetical protein